RSASTQHPVADPTSPSEHAGSGGQQNHHTPQPARSTRSRATTCPGLIHGLRLSLLRMSIYTGPATVTLADGTLRIGTAVLHTTQRGRRSDWRGTFSPNGASPMDAGDA